MLKINFSSEQVSIALQNSVIWHNNASQHRGFRRYGIVNLKDFCLEWFQCRTNEGTISEMLSTPCNYNNWNNGKRRRRLHHDGREGEDDFCRTCMDGDGHGDRWDRILFVMQLPRQQFLPGARPQPLLFQWDAAGNASSRRRWRSYTDDLQSSLKTGYNIWKRDIDAGGECHFQIENEKYKVDWYSMRQINVDTNYMRKIRLLGDE